MREIPGKSGRVGKSDIDVPPGKKADDEPSPPPILDVQDIDSESDLYPVSAVLDVVGMISMTASLERQQASPS